mgnify:CR=1 FL=1
MQEEGDEEVIKTNELKAQMKRLEMTQKDLAKAIGMDPATLNRKINNENGTVLTVKEANEIAQALNIPRESMTDIFFASKLA